MNRPFVSVVVSSYNRPRLIRDAIDSILEQEGMDGLEIIVADDWSDAGTLRVLSEYTQRAANAGVKLWVIAVGSAPPTNQERQFGGRCAMGINAAAFHVPHHHAGGQFLAYLPDDDWLPQGSLASRAQYLIDHPEVNVVFGRLESCIGPAEPGRHAAGDRDGCKHDRNGFWSAEPIMRAANKVDHSMYMVRRVLRLPKWPVRPTTEMLDDAGKVIGEAQRGRSLGAEIWVPSDPTNGPYVDRIDEQFLCPDAGWLFRLERAGLGPFHSIDQVVTVKRYHQHGHQSDPTVRE